MSSENHGVPEDDDPFAYLYRGEGTDGASTQEAAPRPGVPRTSYHQATQVGRTQYGQQPQPQPQLPHQAPGGEQPTAQYQPSQYQASPRPAPPQTPPGGGRAGARNAGNGGGNGRGVMIGTIAVGAALAIGIGYAVFNSGSGKPDTTAAGGGQSASSPASTSASAASSAPSVAPTTGSVPPADAATMTLSGGAVQGSDHKGALGAGGVFVAGMTAPGATVTWSVTAPAKGDYFLWVRYANATGKPVAGLLTVNQKPSNNPIGLKDYGSNGSWDVWFSSYARVSLNAGPNTVALSCAPGANCAFNVDQIALTPPTDSSSRPSTWK